MGFFIKLSKDQLVLAYDPINEILYVNDKDRNNIQVFSVSDSAESTFGSSSHSGYGHEDGNDEPKKSKSHPKHNPTVIPHIQNFVYHLHRRIWIAMRSQRRTLKSQDLTHMDLMQITMA